MSGLTKQELRAKTAAIAVNKTREIYCGKEFTLETLAKDLRAQGCPYYRAFVSYLKKKLIITTSSINNYVFQDQPVSYKIIEIGLNEISSINSGYIEKYLNKKKESKEIEICNNISEEQINHMIHTLKKLGYKILKQKIDYEEC